jgi:hypothetical protein
MLRALVLTTLAGALLCVLFVAPQPTLLADTSGMQGSTPKQPEMDVPPAVSSPTASQLQTIDLFTEWAGDFPQATHERIVRALPSAAGSLRESVQASTVLRI